ncbi:MAG: hypothetical protein GYB41_16845 [Oceanospirillales bacterium]|uniref:Type IV pilus assembly protein PilX n=1 Tax=Marinobacterium halophilum TaxID=267374 RepID=A0A2P8F296_9GAMM|nr:PilX N-terminal domain-containing pilus assembly protein [Marinobacterium halophilum]MBR9830275.1 hypothetical protein [Oceanospirillales bacterium]PSL15848.1 type IV pilus assembly protein PilX [Marinobacterium halophilum]
MNQTPYAVRHQDGATLLVAMIMLVLITIVGFSAMQTATVQERMTGNLRDKEVSFQAAEAALREQEAMLREALELPELAEGASQYGDGASTDLSAVSGDPESQVEKKYFIADSLDLGFKPQTGRDVYRIEAKGFGQSDQAESVLETLYAKRFN